MILSHIIYSFVCDKLRNCGCGSLYGLVIKTIDMKKNYFFTVLLALFALVGANAQEWSVTLNINDGLPGTVQDYYGTEYYKFTSQLITPDRSTNKIRMTVTGSVNNEAPNGNNVIFSLSELKIYDGQGNPVRYTASSNADHNTLAYYEDGDGLPALSDDDIKSYFHSMWRPENYVSDYHYVEVELEKSIDAFVIEWTTRLGESKNSPTTVGITLGTDYAPKSVGSEFTLGDDVVTESALAAVNQLFVLRGNAANSFATSSGTTYFGSGPIFMRYAEEGDKEASIDHVMQLIPAGNGRYLVYWPMAGKYLANSAGQYNGLNGWQYSTSNFMDAARVKLTYTGMGYFEMQYDGSNSAGELVLYVGAELRDGVNSKMKTFDLEHKEALERGDYTQGYSLPVAFNWSIYKAEVSEETLNELCVELSQLAINYLRPTINKAKNYLVDYGDHEGNCNGENTLLSNGISSAEASLSSIASVAEIEEIEAMLFGQLSRYMAVGLVKYEKRVDELLATSTFSSYPYQAGTYPTTSRTLLESIKSTITVAKEKAGVYNAEQYVNVFSQIENDIELFLSTKVIDGTEPDGGDNEEEEEEIVEGEIVYVYLADGGVDAYELASIDGGYYTENGKLFFPIKDGDVVYYTAEEYDSCSLVRPQLPTMTSFKFNNKYNPNLNVDAEAENVSSDMRFGLNSIGKWLTASFQLSDDKAVAYVDTVLQESKVTRQSFANRVTYKVTYPGYNIVKRVKVQDEIWSTPSSGGDVVEVPLTADMLYTNKPSQSSNESLANLLDGNPNSIFHSTWGSANNATVNVNTYITIDLPESLENIKVYYKCRPSTGYNPLVWEIYGSNDGFNWTLVTTLDYIKDNMPRGGAGQEFTSPEIALGRSYSKLKILQTSGEYSKNHMVLSELRIYKVVPETTEEPVKIQDAVYENRCIPFGREYNVKVDWLTDNAVSVPRIDIDIDGGKFVTSKSYYLNAKFRITGYGVYDNFEDSVQIKGRGNSTWGYSKKPYRLKFADKVKPFGLTKGKSWVLLANAQTGSLMANAIAMKVGQMAGAKYTNHIIPVELYMNGQYMGNYMFTEKVGMANNSVDIDEELGYLLELDTYGSTDEPIYRTGVYNLPVKVAEPDLEDYSKEVATARRTAMLNDVKSMSNAIFYGDDIESVLDVDATARFLLANDLVLNQEINHPKSTFLFKDETTPDGKLAFGPLWDFDWGFGYEGSSRYCYTNSTASIVKTGFEAYEFWQDLMDIELFKRHYYKVWKEFVENNSLEELKDYIDSYFTFSKNSFQNNANEWGYSNGFTESDATRAKEWLETRYNYLYNNLAKYDIDDLIYTLAGDVDCNNQLTVHDIALLTAYLNGDVHKDFRLEKADCDGNGNVTASDVPAVASCVIDAPAPSSAYWYYTPAAAGALQASAFTLEIGSEAVVPVTLVNGSDEFYNALQFDVKVPEGVYINDIVAGEGFEGIGFEFAELAANTYRVVAYTEDNSPFVEEDAVIADLSLQTFSVIEEASRKLDVTNVYAVNYDNEEVRMSDFSISFGETTGIDTALATVAVKGGECIIVTALAPQDIAVYTVDGRLVHKVRVAAGTTRIGVPAGMYVVNGEKVLVY